MKKDEARLRDFVFSGKSAAELAPEKERETTPLVPETGDFANTPFKGDGAFEREEPPKDHMRRYWRQYETTPMVRNPVNAFASQVVEPGYWIESEHLNDEELKELNKWLRKAAIIEKEPENDILHLLKKAVVQREVRGTAIINKVYAAEDEEKLYGLSFLNAETVRPNTRPGRPLLLMPEDKPGDFDMDGKFPETEDGKAAAYTQYTTKSGMSVDDPENEDVNNFSFDDVMKLTRDADVNEAFGTSRLEACSDVIEGLKQKMLDQNEAIASKAYPLWLFLFGTEEQPWDRDDIRNFMGAHEMDQFHPGLKQGVRGDVDIKTISGEVADVVDYLEFDINYIMSAMPMPKYILGGFEQNINQHVSQTQERSINQQIKEARNELEAELSEVVQQKCMELFSVNDEDAEEIFFRIGRPEEEMIEEDNPQVNTINYVGKDERQQNERGPAGPPQGAGNKGGDGSGGGGGDSPPEEENSVWDVSLSDAEELQMQGEGSSVELEDPRFVRTDDVEQDLAQIIEQTMEHFRDNTLRRVENQYRGAPFSASMAFEDAANTQVNRTMQQNGFGEQAEILIGEAMRRATDVLSDVLPGDGFGNEPSSLRGFRFSRNVEAHAQSVQSATRDALEQLVRRMDRQLEVGANNSEELGAILSRMTSTYSDEQLQQRAQLIARMEIQHAVEATKLESFEEHPDVEGVRVINPCNASTTRLCKNLGGCGIHGGAVATFENKMSLSEQWSEQAGTSGFKGFTPLPSAPPFHFNCRSQLAPVTEEQLEDALNEKPVTSVEELTQKYGVE